MIQNDTLVDLHFYGDHHSAHVIRGTVTGHDQIGVMITSGYGQDQFFPWTSVARIVPIT